MVDSVFKIGGNNVGSLVDESMDNGAVGLSGHFDYGWRFGTSRFSLGPSVGADLGGYYTWNSVTQEVCKEYKDLSTSDPNAPPITVCSDTTAQENSLKLRFAPQLGLSGGRGHWEGGVYGVLTWLGDSSHPTPGLRGQGVYYTGSKGFWLGAYCQTDFGAHRFGPEGGIALGWSRGDKVLTGEHAVLKQFLDGDHLDGAVGGLIYDVYRGDAPRAYRDGVTDKVIHFTYDSSPSVRSRVANLLKIIFEGSPQAPGANQAVRALTDLLNDADAGVRIDSMNALGIIYEENSGAATEDGVVAVLMGGLFDPDADVRNAFVDAMGNIYRGNAAAALDAGVVAKFEKVLVDGSLELDFRKTALESLGEIFYQSPENVPPSIFNTFKTNSLLRETAARVLGRVYKGQLTSAKRDGVLKELIDAQGTAAGTFETAVVEALESIGYLDLDSLFSFLYVAYQPTDDANVVELSYAFPLPVAGQTVEIVLEDKVLPVYFDSSKIRDAAAFEGTFRLSRAEAVENGHVRIRYKGSRHEESFALYLPPNVPTEFQEPVNQVWAETSGWLENYLWNDIDEVRANSVMQLMPYYTHNVKKAKRDGVTDLLLAVLADTGSSDKAKRGAIVLLGLIYLDEAEKARADGVIGALKQVALTDANKDIQDVAWKELAKFGIKVAVAPPPPPPSAPEPRPEEDVDVDVDVDAESSSSEIGRLMAEAARETNPQVKARAYADATKMEGITADQKRNCIEKAMIAAAAVIDPFNRGGAYYYIALTDGIDEATKTRAIDESMTATALISDVFTRSRAFTSIADIYEIDLVQKTECINAAIAAARLITDAGQKTEALSRIAEIGEDLTPAQTAEIQAMREALAAEPDEQPEAQPEPPPAPRPAPVPVAPPAPVEFRPANVQQFCRSNAALLNKLNETQNAAVKTALEAYFREGTDAGQRRQAEAVTRAIKKLSSGRKDLAERIEAAANGIKGCDSLFDAMNRYVATIDAAAAAAERAKKSEESAPEVPVGGRPKAQGSE